MTLDAILGERLAILGGTGSGKSYAARGLAERILAGGGRLGVIDPTGVWWGIRSEYPVVLFGGDHADLPLTEHAGRVVAQAVATSQQSWIIDTSALQTKAAERRFMLDFLDSLFAANRAKITLIVDEADRFSPQRMSPETTRLHERMEEIVRRGRVRGFTPWLITQRPASLNKDVLSQATALICMRMTGAQDRGAIGDVIEGQADKATAKAIIDAMPRHQTGEGMVWAPTQGILLPAKFPRIKTFDSMSADTAHKHVDRKLPPIDVESLKEKLASVEEETKANDPAALKKRIKELEAEVARKPATRPDQSAIDAARAKGYSDGLQRGLGITETNMRSLEDFGRKIVEIGRDMSEALARGMASAMAERANAAPPVGSQMAAPGIVHRQEPYRPAPAAPVVTRDVRTADDLSRGERAVLTVLAQFHPKPIPPKRAAAIAGYSVRASTWRGILAKLRQRDAITGSDLLGITPDGSSALGSFTPLPTGPALLQHWIERLPKGQAETLKVLAAIGGQGNASDVAGRAGYSTAASTWRGILAGLRNLDLVEGSRTLKLNEDLR